MIVRMFGPSCRREILKSLLPMSSVGRTLISIKSVVSKEIWIYVFRSLVSLFSIKLPLQPCQLFWTLFSCGNEFSFLNFLAQNLIRKSPKSYRLLSRSEVMKERHSTANQLRKYYLECLKQILDEDKEAYKNNKETKSNEDKLKMMEDRLRLPGEKQGTISYTHVI